MDADAGSTVGGTASAATGTFFPGQVLGSWCFDMLSSGARIIRMVING